MWILRLNVKLLKRASRVWSAVACVVPWLLRLLAEDSGVQVGRVREAWSRRCIVLFLCMYEAQATAVWVL
jgi:hypothetical protein